MVKMQRAYRSLKKDKTAVSAIIGYILTLVMCAMILTSSVLMINMLVEKRSDASARIEAKAIANRIVDIIIDAAEVSQKSPNIVYSRTMRLPDKIGNYNYYVEGTDDAIYVKSNNGRINEKCTTYNIMAGMENVYGITGKVYSGTDIEIKIG